MVCHAVIASQYQTRYQTEKLFGFDIERAFFVRASVEREEPIYDEIPLVEDLLVHPLAEDPELFERIAVIVTQNFQPLRVLIAFSSALRWSGYWAVVSSSSYAWMARSTAS